MTENIQFNPQLQQMRYALGVPDATTVKVEKVTKHLFSKMWDTLTNGIRSFFGIGVQERQDLFKLAHSVKNHGYMTQAEFFAFQEAYDQGSSKEVLQAVSKKLFDEKIIDRKHFFTLMVMAHTGDNKGVLNLLYGLSSIQRINTFQEELKQLVSPQEHNQLIDLLKYTYDTGRFQESDLKLLNDLKAKVEILRYLPEQGLNEAIEPLLKNDEKGFLAAIKKKTNLTFQSFNEFYEMAITLDHLSRIVEQLEQIEDKSSIKADYSRFIREEEKYIQHSQLFSVLNRLNSAFKATHATEAKTDALFNKPAPFYQSLKGLTEAISSIPVKAAPSIDLKGKHLVLNGNLEWVELKEQEPKKALFTLRMLMKGNEPMAKVYLDYLINEYSDDLDKGYKACKRSSLMMEIAEADRRYNAPHYKTQVALDQLNRWTKEKQADARDHWRDKRIMSEEVSEKFFEKYPAQYEWIMEMRLQRSASTFNHEWVANEEGELLIPTPTRLVRVSELMEKGIRCVNDKMIDLNTGDEYIYDQTGFHILDPEKPFKIKEKRKHEDWRLEIATDTGVEEETGSQQHSYVYLKTPNGEVYSLGKFWDPDTEFPGMTSLLKAIPAYIKSGDLHDYMPRMKTNKDPRANIKVTKINLGSEENFKKALKFIAEYKTTFQMSGDNCTNFPIDLAAHFGIYPKAKVTAASYLLPLPLGLRKYLVEHPGVQKLSMFLLYPLKLVFNIVYLALGALKIDPMADKCAKPLFSSVLDFFNPKTTLINFPSQLRAWQEVMQDKYGNKVFTLEEMQEYTK